MSLTPVKHQILDAAANMTSPMIIKGVAGSGKSAITLKIADVFAKQQLPNHVKTRVHVVTYTNILTNHLQTQANNSNIVSTTAHEALNRFLETNGHKRLQDVFENSEWPVLHEISQTQPFSKYAFNFLREEFKRIENHTVTKPEQYRATCLSAATKDFTDEEKDYLWALYQAYKKELRKKGKYMFEEMANICLDIIRQNPRFTPLCTHLIIDEFQDLEPNVIEALSKMCQIPQNIVFVGDLAQDIYSHSKSWKDIGSDDKKVFELRENTRNTKQIAAAAQSLLDNEYALNAHDRQDYTDMIPAGDNGSKPVLVMCRNAKEQWWYVKNELKNIPAHDSVAIIYRKRTNEIANHIGACKTIHSIKFFDTMHKSKGLEFDYVFIINANDDCLPNRHALEQDRDIAISQERRLLYVAMTRARKQLFILTSSEPSRLVAQINPTTLSPIALDYKAYERFHQMRVDELLNQSDKIKQLQQQIRELQQIDDRNKERLSLLERQQEFLDNNLLWTDPTKKYFRNDAKILILGGDNGLSLQDAQQICKKEFGIDPRDIEWISYEGVVNFNPQKLQGTHNYCDVIVGAVPHKSGTFDNLVSQFEQHREDYSPAIHILRAESGALEKLTATNFKAVLKKSNKAYLQQ